MGSHWSISSEQCEELTLMRQRLRVASLQLPNSSLKGLHAGRESASRRFCNFAGRRTWSLCSMLKRRGKSNLAPLWATKTTFFCSVIAEHHLLICISTCLPVALNYLKKSPRTAAASSSAARSSPRRTKRPFLTFIPCTIVAPQWIDTVGTMNLPKQFFTSIIIAKSFLQSCNHGTFQRLIDQG